MIHILYVDDEPILLDFGKEFLERDPDLIVDTTPSAYDALLLLKQNHYDVVVSDYLMPEMDGISFLKEVRTLSKKIPFIFFTGRGNESMVIQAINNGADFFLTKDPEPVQKLIELSQAIKQGAARYQAEQLFRKSEEKLRTIADYTYDWEYWLDQNGTLLYISPSCARISGYTPEEFYQDPNLLNSIIFEEDQELWKEHYDCPGSESGVSSIEFRIVTKEDGIRWINHGCQPVYGAEGIPLGRRVSNRDISAMKKAQGELEASEARYRGIIENSAAGVVYTNISGQYLFANEAFLSLLGYTLDELKKLTIDDITFSGDKKLEFPLREELIRGERSVFRMNKRYLTKDSRLIWVDISVSIIRDLRGEPTHFIGIVLDISLQKRAEKKLIESERQAQALITYSPVGIAIVLKGQIQYVNKELLRMFKYGSAIDLLGTPVINLIDASERDKVLVFNWKRSLDEIQIDSLETYGKRSDNTSFPLLISTSVIEQAEGMNTIAFFQDISTRKQAELDIRASEEKYRFISENTGDVISLYDAHTLRYTYVSPSVVEQLGFTPDEMISRSLSEFIPVAYTSQIRELLYSWIEAYRKGDESTRYQIIEAEAFRKDGSTIPTEAVTTLLSDNERNVTSVLSVTRDISARKDAEQTLRRSKAALRTVLDSMNEAVFIHDTTGQILDYNAQMLKMFRIPDPELAKTWSFSKDYSASDNTIGLLPKIWWDVIEGKSQFFEWRSRRPSDGSLFDAEVYMTRIDLPQGPAVLTSVNDISERKQAQSALEQVNKKLNLLSSITRHDILNSLTAMIGYLGFVKEIAPEGKVATLIMKIDSLAQTIRNQIGFTRDYQDLGIHAATWQDVDRLIKIVSLIKPGNMTITSDLSGLSVFADPLLEKVIYNLLDNAIRHGEWVTEIRNHWYRDGAGIVWVFEDNGAGVPAAMKERIFRQGVGKNTGLGLFLVREILSITGMTIRETGVQGEGARFEILVPEGGFRII
ncbi:MAG TPA: PAS domain S-box protein [Methanospirillum sp.]|nr:PAS domain S-box protein [Methanospirillum sp.]